jgi:PIN domain nuclease of toxin-antitoxin system
LGLLLDTNAFLWWVADSQRLGTGARMAIAGESTVVVSAATGFEITTKRRLGKLSFDGDVLLEVERNGFTPLAITMEHGAEAGALPAHHNDPFDRILIAQALLEHMTVITSDMRFTDYGVPVLAT